MLGPPGAGKGTQTERLARVRRLPNISTGDILREAVQAESEVGLAAKARMAAGSLIGDDVMIDIVRERLDRDDARGGFVIDSVVPEDVLVRRLATRRICSKCGTNADVEWTGACQKCGGALIARMDDGVQIVRERLKVYQRQTKPLVDYYSTRPTFRSIDGNQPPDIVTAQLDAAVTELSRSAAL